MLVQLNKSNYKLYHYLKFYNTTNVVLGCKLRHGHDVHTVLDCWIEDPIEAKDVKEGQDT